MIKQKGQPRGKSRYGRYGYLQRHLEHRQERRVVRGLLEEYRAGREEAEDHLPYRQPKEWLD